MRSDLCSHAAHLRTDAKANCPCWLDEHEGHATPRGLPQQVFADGFGAYRSCRFCKGWGTLALINAGLAQGKGRSGLIWCLLSLVLGPIATFLIVVLEKARLDEE